MKKIYVWTLSILTLTACTMDENDNQRAVGPKADNRPLQKVAGYPENTANIYDLAGQMHFEFCDSYLSGSQDITSLTDAIAQTELIAAGNTDYLAMKPLGYTSPTASRLAYILEEKPGRITEVLGQSSLTWRAQVSLANFISSVQWYRDQKAEYASIYKFIIGYENSILGDTLFTPEDRRILLTTSSIARYSFYFAQKEKEKEPKRRDRDWDISMGNIVAGVDGANESMVKAVSASTAAALYVNR